MQDKLWIYSGTIVKVVDGDTVDAIIQVGFYMTTRQRLRLARVNAFEINSADLDTRIAAQLAKSFVEEMASLHPVVFIRTEKTDAFGRFLAEVFYGDGLNLSDELLRRGLARPYARVRGS